MTGAVATGNLKGSLPVAYSLPRVLGAKGVIATLTPPLSKDEGAALKRSAKILQGAWDELNLSHQLYRSKNRA